MPIVQRSVERQVSIPSAAFALAARSSPERVYLLFAAATATPTLVASMKPGTAPSAAMVVTTGAPGYPRWELFRSTHGKLVEEEWYIAPGSGLGGFSITVIEVFEEDTGPRRTSGGIYLPGGSGLLDSINESSMNRATVLARAIERGMREWKNGTATDKFG